MNNSYEKTLEEDMAESRYDEKMVELVLADILKDWDFKQVGTDKEFYKKGDILAVDTEGKTHLLEVKTDSRWCGKKGTNNLFSEQYVRFYDDDKLRTRDGFMRDGEYSTIFWNNREMQRLLVCDFRRWKSVYTFANYGRTKVIHHPEYRIPSTSIGYLNPIETLKESGVLRGLIEYDFSNTYHNPKGVYAVSVKSFEEYDDKAEYWENRFKKEELEKVRAFEREKQWEKDWEEFCEAIA